MNEYTPTTEVIRYEFVNNVPGFTASLVFDRWLAQHDAEVAKATEERIIKLLEEHAEGDLLFAQDLKTPSQDVAYTMFKGDIIELIKGEQK